MGEHPADDDPRENEQPDRDDESQADREAGEEGHGEEAISCQHIRLAAYGLRLMAHGSI